MEAAQPAPSVTAAGAAESDAKYRVFYALPVNDRVIPTRHVKITWNRRLGVHFPAADPLPAIITAATVGGLGATIDSTTSEGSCGDGPSVGKLRDYVRWLEKGVAYASFDSEETAAAARGALNDQPCVAAKEVTLMLEFCGGSFMSAATAATLLEGPVSEHTMIQSHARGHVGMSVASPAVSSTAPGDICSVAAAVATIAVLVPLPREARRSVVGPAAIPGLLCIHNFVSVAEERELLAYADAQIWTTTLVRRVQHYGHGFDYITRGTLDANATPRPFVRGLDTCYPTGDASCSVPSPIGASTPSDSVVRLHDRTAASGSSTCSSGTVPVPSTTAALETSASARGDGSNDYTHTPRVFAMDTSVPSPLLDLATRLAGYGFVGDAGDSRLDTLRIQQPLSSIEELQSLISTAAPLVNGSVEAATCSPSQVVVPLTSDTSHTVAINAVTTATTDESVGRRAFPMPNQLTVNEYSRGQGISGHIDTHESFEDGIVSLSLGGEVVMEFTYAAQEPRGEASDAVATTAHAIPTPAATAVTPVLRAYVVLPARSLLVLRGEARFAWAHTIPARRNDFIDGAIHARPERRISITCRVVRQASDAHPRGDISTCPCLWKSVCRSQTVENGINSPHLQKLAQQGISQASITAATADGSDPAGGGVFDGKHGAPSCDCCSSACGSGSYSTSRGCSAACDTDAAADAATGTAMVAGIDTGSYCHSMGGGRGDASVGMLEMGGGVRQTHVKDHDDGHSADRNHVAQSPVTDGVTGTTEASPLLDTGESTSTSTSTPLETIAVSSGPAAPDRTGKNIKATPVHSSGASGDASTTAAATGSELATPDVESKHVHALYDAIAPHFSSTRYAPWPAVERFMHQLPHNSFVLDIGCGNGKYMGVNPHVTVVGCDRSEGLLSICGEKGYDVAVADAVTLPYRSNLADATLNIAVLHHISTLPRRVALVRELFRVTRPGGIIFIQAWALEQGSESRRAFDSQDVFVPWNLQARYITGSSLSEEQQLEAMTQLKGAGGVHNSEKKVVVFQRFCHVYARGELEELVALAACPHAPDVSASAAILVTAATSTVRCSGGEGESVAVPGTDVSVEGIASISPAVPLTTSGDTSPAVKHSSTASGGDAASSTTTESGADGTSTSSSDVRVHERAHIVRTWWERDNWCMLVRKVGAWE